jgi:hypothetical protein
VSDATCKTCPWWDATRDNAPVGYCKAHPPTTFADGTSDWPTILASSWCGEHPDRQQSECERLGYHVCGLAGSR